MLTDIMEDNHHLRSESLFKIISTSPYFEEAIELYVYSLSLKQNWKSLESKRKSMKLRNSSANKMAEWERFARRKHMKAKDDALKSVKMAAHGLEPDIFEELKIWIQNSECSKIAYKKRPLSIEDGIGIIEARLVQIVYMYKVGAPVNFGTSFLKDEHNIE